MAGPPAIFPIGTRVRVTREKSQKHIGLVGEITTVPSQPNSWYRIRFSDGEDIRLRKTQFEALSDEEAAAAAAAAAAETAASADSAVAAALANGATDSADAATANASSATDAAAPTSEAAAENLPGTLAVSSASAAQGSAQGKSIDGDAGAGAGAAQEGPNQLAKNARAPSSSSASSNTSSMTSDNQGSSGKVLLTVGRQVRIRDINNARSRVLHLVGQTGYIEATPHHPNTWFSVRMNDSGDVFKFQGPGLLPLGEDGKEIELHDDEEDQNADAGDNDGDSGDEPSNRRRRRGARPLVTCNRPGVVASARLLADTPPNLWEGAQVIIKSAQFEGELARVLRSGNGWVQLRREEDGPDADVEFARRANELVLPVGSPLLDSVVANGDEYAGNDSDNNHAQAGHDEDDDDENDDDEEDDDGMDSGDDGNRNSGASRRRKKARLAPGKKSQAGGVNSSSSSSSSTNSNGAAKPLRRKTSRRSANNAANGSAGQQDSGNSGGLVGRKCVITYGSKLGTIGTILSGNGYWYIKTSEKRVRKKRDQFEVLEDAVPVLGEIVKSEKDAPRMLQAVLDGNGPDAKQQAADLQVTHFTKSYFVLQRGGGASGDKMGPDFDHVDAAAAAAAAEDDDMDEDDDDDEDDNSNNNDAGDDDDDDDDDANDGQQGSTRPRRKRRQTAKRRAPAIEDGPIARLHEAVSFPNMPKAILRQFFVQVGQITAESEQRKSTEALGKRKRGAGGAASGAAGNSGLGNSGAGGSAAGSSAAGASLSVRSSSEPGTRGRANTRRTALNQALTHDDDAKSSVAGSTSGGPEVLRRQRSTRRASNRSRTKIRGPSRIPLTEDPKINRLLNANKERQDAILAWMTHDRERMFKYNQHRPNLKLWLDRICGDDDADDKYVKPVVKIPHCNVCKLEKRSETASCWNPACWASPVFQRGAAPLDHEGAIPASREEALSDYKFAVLQSPRKPGFIEVSEASFPYMYNVEMRDWSGAARDAQNAAEVDDVRDAKRAAANAAAAVAASSGKLQRESPFPEIKRLSSEAQLGLLNTVSHATMKGWGRFVAGRKRLEEETIVSPLETYHFRAVPITLGCRKRPLDEPRDQGLNGYFGKGWNDELARPYYESRKRRRQHEFDLRRQAGRDGHLSNVNITDDHFGPNPADDDVVMHDARASRPASSSNGDAGDADNDGDDDESSVDEWDTDDLTGLDFRWRSWEATDMASRKTDAHPTFETAASIMSLGTGQINEKQLQTLKDGKQSILKEVDRKLAKKTGGKNAKVLGVGARVKTGTKAAGRANSIPKATLAGLPGLPGSLTAAGAMLGVPPIIAGLDAESLGGTPTSASPLTKASAPGKSPASGGKRSRAKTRRRSSPASSSNAASASSSAAASPTAPNDATARLQSIFQSVMGNRAPSNWHASQSNAPQSAQGHGSGSGEITPMQQLEQLQQLQQQLANATSPVNNSTITSSVGGGRLLSGFAGAGGQASNASNSGTNAAISGTANVGGSGNGSNPTTTLFANLFNSGSSRSAQASGAGSSSSGIPGDLLNALQNGQLAMNLLSNLQQNQSQQGQQGQQLQSGNASPATQAQNIADRLSLQLSSSWTNGTSNAMRRNR